MPEPASMSQMVEEAPSTELSRPTPPGVKLRARGQMWYLHDIMEQLSVSKFCILRNSCFAKLFEIGEMHFQGELVNLLCRRLHSSSLDRKTLLFNFSDHLVEFGPADFCAMTGLKFGGSRKLPKNSKFHGEVFSCRNDMFFADIETKFRNKCLTTEGNSVRSVKLAYLLIVYGLLVMNDPSNGKLDLGYMHLVDNMDNFHDFPWGLVAYEYLMAATHRLKTEMLAAENEKSKITLEVSGFIYVLQCWCFEVIPTLGTFCASLNPHNLKSFPRILRWCVSQDEKTFDDGLWKFFIAEHGCDPVRLLLTTREIDILTGLGVTSSMHVASPTPFVDISKPVGRRLNFESGETHERQARKRAYKRKVTPTYSSTAPTTPSNLKVGGDCSVTGCTKKKKKNVVSKCKSAHTDGFDTPEFPYVVADANNNDIISMFVTLKGQLKYVEDFMHMKLASIEVLLGKLIGGVGGACLHTSTNDRFLDVGCDRDAYGYGMEFLPNAGDFVNVSRQVKKKAAVGENISRNNNVGQNFCGSDYDPNDSDLLSAELIQFVSWIRGGNYTSGDNQVLLPTDMLKFADAPWFDVIWRRDGWLDNSHIDALTNLLIMRYDKDDKTRKPRKWTCLEMCCWQALQEPNFDDFAHVVLPYVIGERPLRGPVNWLAATNVYGVANINKNHWVLFDVSLEEQLITVYNSLEQSWVYVEAHFDHMRKNIPTVCAMAGIGYSRAGSKLPMEDCWRVVKFPKPPRQVNMSDCGVMVMKYMECLAFNVPIQRIIPDLCWLPVDGTARSFSIFRAI
ncbi:uncharacterized protein LOC131025122 [Salvia miltiorrhiza]|uniref:uncharacterized protein LOC131025122 n=1 Tax=Salvia miltiorrhiza TaxID=226208 RepID=UPI0025AD6DFC|nr:uncharacterized protein LOC131025122 [Salvia miltiorrhiza]